LYFLFLCSGGFVKINTKKVRPEIVTSGRTV